MTIGNLVTPIEPADIERILIDLREITQGINEPVQQFNGVLCSRSYQENAVDLITSFHRDVFSLEAGCGSGKSIIAALVAKKLGGPALFICPSRMAMETGINKSFMKAWPKVRIAKTNVIDFDADVMFFTPRKFVHQLQAHPDLFSKLGVFFLDEAHHFPVSVEGGKKVRLKIYGQLGEFANRISGHTRVVSLTATHGRMDGGMPLGKETPDLRITTYNLVKDGYCIPILGATVYLETGNAKIQAKGVDYMIARSTLDGEKYWISVIDTMVKIWKDHKKIPACVFVRTVKEAKYVAHNFNFQSGLGEGGLAVLTGSTSLFERELIVDRIRSGSLLGYVTIGVGSESLDIPELAICHLIVRTKSINKMVQCVGRTLRMSDGKRFSLIVDYNLKKAHIVKACMGMAEYAVAIGMPHSKAGSLRQVGKIFEENRIDARVRLDQIEAWISCSTLPPAIFLDAFSKRGPLIEEAKAKLLQMAKNGDPKPYGDDLLAHYLKIFTTPNQPLYDPKFLADLEEANPQWSHSHAKKELLLKMARNGEPRPGGSKSALESGSLYRCFIRYINPEHQSYDPDFVSELKKIRPDWLIKRGKAIASPEGMKEILLEMAKRGDPKPRFSNDKSLYQYLVNFLNPNNHLYDPKFVGELEEINSDWTVRQHKKVQEKKERCLRMARRGETKPSGKLGEFLKSYINSTEESSDLDFTSKLKEANPEWFQPVAEVLLKKRKQEFIAIAKKGESRSSLSHSSKQSLRSYLRKDPDFFLAVKKANPEWVSST